MSTPFLPPAGGFVELFHSVAASDGDRLFARCAGEDLTFAEMDRRSDALAAALLGAGVVKGDRVATMLPNGSLSLLLIYALAKARIIWVPLNPQATGEGLRYILRHAAPRLVIAAAAAIPVLEAAGAERILPDHALDAAARAAASGRFAWEAPDPAEDFAICYTSGTTGPPKGVRVSHRMLRLAGEGAVLVADARDGDVMFMWEPLYHIGGAQMAVVPVLRRAHLHMVPRFSASVFWLDAAKAGATHIHFLGGILQLLLKQPPSPIERLHGVRVAWGGGCPLEIWDQVQARFGVALRECYGMTESSSFTTSNTDGPRGAVGRAMPWFAVEIRDGEGRLVPAGARGEIVVRAHDRLALTRGYLDNPEATARSFRNGALHTGDSGSLDAQGNLYFHGRMTDSARVRGENVSAWEVESVVAQHPDVAACAMIGIPADLGEQEIKLFVALRASSRLAAPALSAWLATRLARYQQPRFIAIVADFERTPSQRIMKHRLPTGRDDCWDRLGGAAS